MRALRGLNLGGWLVAERWMTPALFAGVSGEGEAALVRELGRQEAGRRLQRHRDEFMAETDFEWIAGQRFDFVRLPVGYWTFEVVEDFIDGESYIERALIWAEKYNLRVLLDFHGLQGSQNGQDHSGVAGRVRLYRGGNRAAALRTFEYICRTYGKHPALLGVEIINEPKLPWFFGWHRLLAYYDRAVAVASRYLHPEAKIIVSDAFRPREMARRLSRLSYGNRVVLDVHLYRVFGKKEQGLSYEQHMAAVRNDWQTLLADLSATMPVLVGEWSAALPTTAETNDFNKEYFHLQRAVFDECSWGHCYWAYKVPGAGAWDYRSRREYR